METGEWIEAFRTSRGFTQRGLSLDLHYKGDFVIKEVEKGIKPGFGILSRIIKVFEVRPDDAMIDQCLSEIKKMKRPYPNRIKHIIETAKKWPVWMPNSKEEKQMLKPETTRGKTMLKIAEKPDQSQDVKDNGKSVALLRRLKRHHDELSSLSTWAPEYTDQSKLSVFDRIKGRLLKKEEREVFVRAKKEAQAELYEELCLDIVELTGLRISSLRNEMEKLSKHYQSVLSDLAKLEAKVKACQDELNMLDWSLCNSFAYIELELDSDKLDKAL